MRISKQLFADLQEILTDRQLEVLDRVVIEPHSPRELFILIPHHNPRLQRLAELTDAPTKELERIDWVTIAIQ